MTYIRSLKTLAIAIAIALALLPAGSHALESVSDDDLSGVSGQSGFSLLVVSNPAALGTGIGDNDATPTTIHINPDFGTATSSDFVVTGYQMMPIGDAGAVAATPMNIGISSDVGADAAGSGFGLAVTWTRSRTLFNNLSLCTGDFSSCPQRTAALGASPASLQTFGQLVTDNSGQLTIASSQGLFNTTALDAKRLLRLTLGPNSGGVGTGLTQFGAYQTNAGYGQLYYKQGTLATSPELLLDNIYFDAGIHPGSGGVLGVCTTTGTCGYTNNTFAPTSIVAGQQGYSGFYFVTPRLDFTMTFDFNFIGGPTSSYTSSTTAGDYLNSASTSTVRNLAVWGWNGDFSGTGYTGNTNSGAGLLIGGGGAWTAPAAAATYSPDTPANRTNGLNIAFRGNFDPTNFTWYVGRAGGVLAFGNWTTITGASWSLNAPNITLDMVNAGQGPGGLCWGASKYGGTTACTGTTFNKPIIPGITLAVAGQFLDTNLTGGASPHNTVLGAGSDSALGLFIRDLSLQAYSTQVQILDDIDGTGTFTGTGSVTKAGVNGGVATAVAKTQTEPWTLMYTLGQLDANVYLYPGNGGTTAGSNGLTTDILLMTQSFAPSSNTNPLLGNSNFLIGETCDPSVSANSCNIASGTTWCNPNCTLAVGLAGSNLMFAANQLHLNLNGNSTTYSNFFSDPAGATPPTFGPGIQFQTNDFRDQISGLFAGGLVTGSAGASSMLQPGANTTVAGAGQNQIVASYLDLNIESNSTDITISPQLTSYNGPSGKPYSYMGLAGHIRFISPGAPNNNGVTSNVGSTSPTATALQLQPTGCTPSNTNWYVACNGTNDGTYFSASEPSQPLSSIRFADIQGDITIMPCSTAANCNGTLSSPTPSQVFLISGGDPQFPNDTKARLRFAMTMVLGTSPGGTIGVGQEPVSTIVKFGSNPLGTMIIPSAQIYSSVTLRPQ